MWSFNNKTKKEIDVNKPVENPKLLEALSKHRSNASDQSAINVAYEITKAIFLVPMITDEIKTTPSDHEGEVTINKGSIIKILNCFNGNNECFLPIFTDWNEIQKWTQEPVNTLIMPFSHICGFVEKDQTYAGAVINPGSIGWTLTKENIEAFKEDFKIET